MIYVQIKIVFKLFNIVKNCLNFYLHLYKHLYKLRYEFISQPWLPGFR